MDYLLTCETPSSVCYITYLQAYAHGCHILNLPFVERIAKVDFECMIRKRFFDVTSDEQEMDILEAVLKAAYIPLMPAWFFEQQPVTQMQPFRKRRSSLPRPFRTTTKAEFQATNTSRQPTTQGRQTPCSRTAFTASYQYAASVYTTEEEDNRSASALPKPIFLQIVLRLFHRSSQDIDI
ncbi:uncharacterized protein DFL_002793 [Arthrobotrys flagrans]|uniref:Uncharacterized protein n=1 Tax=Arthrobotrys flagrans TaxID=97331 RepID=A0A437ABG9_ARTFL|nr:hypothetical protein DFL_002793 [Arthrobotrys flagrans]